MKPGCILCANGNDLPDGAQCAGCGREGGYLVREGPSKHQQMREAINAVELALNALQVDDIVDAWDGAMDTVKIRVPLGALRRLAKCYPELNRIINDPDFERP